MDVSVTLWVLTIVGLAALIAVDFFIGRKPHDVSIKEAGIWTVVWIVLAALFGLGLLVFSGGQPAGEFFAGFITEKSLSVDNLFVFVLIMAKFAVPSQYQQRVLLIGVLIALVLRAIFIAAGAAILASFAWVFYIFGAFLIYTAWKLIQEARADESDEDWEENKLLKAAEKRFGVADRYHGTKLWIEQNGKRIMTPMLVVMLAIGTTDVLFALDSIPAIFGLTQDPYIVFTANAFALMGLRQLYFLIGGLLRKLVHLSYGLSVILGFIGVKLVLHALHESGVHVPEISIPVSLGVICACPGGHHDHQPDGLPRSRRRLRRRQRGQKGEGLRRTASTSDRGGRRNNQHRERRSANCRPPLPVLACVLSGPRPGDAWPGGGTHEVRADHRLRDRAHRRDAGAASRKPRSATRAGRGGPTHRMLLQDRDNPQPLSRRHRVRVVRGSHAQQRRPRDRQDGGAGGRAVHRPPTFTDCDVREMDRAQVAPSRPQPAPRSRSAGVPHHRSAGPSFGSATIAAWSFGSGHS